jgi:hypothetical protein
MAPSEPPFWLEKLEKQKKFQAEKFFLQRKKQLRAM